VRITLQEADATRLDIDLSVDGVARRVSLTGLRTVVGQLERGNSSARVHPLRAESVVLAALEWPLPAGGRLSITSPAAVSELAIELDAAAASESTPVSGRASAGRAEADAVALDLRDGARLAFDADLRRAQVEHSPERTGHASAEEMHVDNLQAALGGLLCRLSSAVLERARVDWHASELLVGAAAATATGLSVSVPGTGITVEVERAELPGGVRTSAGAIVIPELVVPEMRVVIDDLIALFRPSPGPRTRTTRETATAAPRPPFDYSFLDRVIGRLDVDMTLDMSMPVIGRREATHHFRVPITNGVINYRELERDLANFEDAFIDVEVRGQTLAIERAIPLIPGLEKPLVVWHLDAEELELARKRLVRLRTIPRLQLVGRGGGGEKSSLTIRSLRFDNIDIAIALAPLAEGQTDSIGRASAAALRVTGRLSHEPHRTAEAEELNRVGVVGTKLAAGPLELPFGAPSKSGPGQASSKNGRPRAHIEVESIELGSLADGVASFSGLRPRGASFTARDLRLHNLRILLPR
jgi:hypothetical protein